MSEYLSGACNIGPAEIKRRKLGALIGAILFAITSFSFAITDAPRTTRLLVFIPALLFSVGMIQSRKKFCVAYGFLGVFNFEKTGDVRKITVNKDLANDRKYAIKLLLHSVLAAGFLTALVTFA